MTGSKGRSGGNRWQSEEDPTPEDGGIRKPDAMPPAVDAMWDELSSRVSIPLRAVDSYQFHHLCLLLVDIEYLAGYLRSEPDNDKLRQQMRMNMQHVSRLSSQFGLSPTDRKRMKIEKAEAKDEFTSWMSDNQ